MASTPDKQWVAIVDDDASVLKALSRLLRAWSFDPVGFSSGEEFLRALRRGAPMIVVLDLQMPGMNGLEVQSALTQAGWNMPVVIITAHEDLGAQERCLTMGAVAYLRKPIDETALLAEIRQAAGAR